MLRFIFWSVVCSLFIIPCLISFPCFVFSGKFTFPAIVAGLAELLGDDDANIRAVAAIALAHAGKLEWVV